MLTIDSLRWDHKAFVQLPSLVSILSNRLATKKILTAMSINKGAIIFMPVMGSGKRIAISSVKNNIILKPGDPRINKKGRNFLETERITKEQDEHFFSVIQNTLDELHLHAKVTLATVEPTVLRDGKVKFPSPVLKSYPVAKTGV